jgi:inorganic triphosphatase YgiF
MGGAWSTWRIRLFTRGQPQAAPLSRSGDPELAPVFTTDFTRSFWLLTPQEGTRIEVALDRGKIVAGDRQEADLRS